MSREDLSKAMGEKAENPAKSEELTDEQLTEANGGWVPKSHDVCKYCQLENGHLPSCPLYNETKVVL